MSLTPDESPVPETSSSGPATTVIVDWTTRITKFVDKNIFTMLALVACLGIFGCESFFPAKTASPLDSKQVSFAQLQAQANQYLESTEEAIALHLSEAQRHNEAAVTLGERADQKVEQFQLASEELNKKREQRWSIVKALADLAGPYGTMAMGFLAAGGFGADNLRKNLVIRRLKNGTTPA